MSRFSMTDLLNNQSKRANKIDEDAFVIYHLPIDKIAPSNDNKYGIRDIEELAASIETVGLLHNLVVKEVNANGYYEIVSGERRFRACRMLYTEGDERFALIPCKIEAGENAALAELKLIHSNSTARVLTDYEKTYQAGRIKELLLALKADGYKFVGRMRDIVADMLKVSPAQVGRMESINKHLSPELTEEFKGGSIGITTAYELSTLPQDGQATALEELRNTGSVEVEKHKKPAPDAPPPEPPTTPQKPMAQPEDNPSREEPIVQQPNTETPRHEPAENEETAPSRKVDKLEIIRSLRHISRTIENGDMLMLGQVQIVCDEAARLLELWDG